MPEHIEPCEECKYKTIAGLIQSTVGSDYDQRVFPVDVCNLRWRDHDFVACDFQRGHGGRCGPRGNLFEPKETK